MSVPNNTLGYHREDLHSLGQSNYEAEKKGGETHTHTHEMENLRAIQGLSLGKVTEVPAGGSGWYQPVPALLPSPEGVGSLPSEVRPGSALLFKSRL